MLWDWVGEIKAVLAALFAPDQYNYLFHMNVALHVHLHIYPRYQKPREFVGQRFTDIHFGSHYDPYEDRELDDATYEAIFAALQRELGTEE